MEDRPVDSYRITRAKAQLNLHLHAAFHLPVAPRRKGVRLV
jgi:hypothetical protein